MLARGPRFRATVSMPQPEHDPEKASPGLDPGWIPVFEKIMLQQ